MTEQPTCETCKWWNVELGEGILGACVRFPPKIIGDDERLLNGYWPETAGDMWCGEHAPKEEPKT